MFYLYDKFDKTKDATASLELVRKLKDPTLNRIIVQFEKNPEILSKDIELLDKAREARNFIAHEGGLIGCLFYVKDEYLINRLQLLRNKLKVLINRDNIISCWIYELEEKEPPSKMMKDSYLPKVDELVFGSLEGIL